MLNKVMIISGLVFLLTVTGACHKINQYFNLPDENPIQKDIEEIIKDEIGIDVKLTTDEKVIENGKEESKNESQESDERI